jgi:hypothetical protein
MKGRFIPELNERLFAHFVAGAWRAPLSDRLLPVARADGGRLGQIVCAGEADVARALGVLRRGAPAEGAGMAELWQALRAEAALVSAMRAEEGHASDALSAPEEVDLPGKGPLVLLSSAAVPVDRLAGALIAGARTGLIWKPAPGAAASAHAMMRALGPGAQGRLVLLQGDHATGELLAGQGGLVWMSAEPVPEELPRPVLSLPGAPVGS